MKADVEKLEEIRLMVRGLIDFVLKTVDDPNNSEVQNYIEIIQECYWRCFEH